MILCKEFCLFVYFRWSDCKIMNKCWFLKKNCFVVCVSEYEWFEWSMEICFKYEDVL